LLDKMGIAYDPAKKFLGVDNKNIGKPVCPNVMKI